MTIITEQSLPYFQFWAGAKDNAAKLTYSELEQIEEVLDEIFPDGMEESKLNDWFWFEFEDVCELIGLKYNVETDEIERD